jgi:uncharacterized membrane protein YfhO
MERVLPGAGVCILTSYYMGFMLCTFAALYYLANAGCWQNPKRPEKIPHSLLKFAGASIAGAGLAGITLIPGIVAVSRTPAAAGSGNRPFRVCTEISGNSWAH